MAVSFIPHAICASVIALCLGCTMLMLKSTPYANLPSHMQGHPALAIEDIMTTATSKELMSILKKMAASPPYIPIASSTTRAARSQGLKPLREHIGEARPMSPEGFCPHPYLVPSSNGTLCVLQERIDIYRHFIKMGDGSENHEVYEDFAPRLLSFFLSFMHNVREFPAIQKLLDSESFQSAARHVCPVEKQYVDPFDFAFVVQLPGHSVHTHIEPPWFQGATPGNFPQWLLAAMLFSGMFQEELIDQVQVVAYIHDWLPNSTTGGEFKYWAASSEPHRVSPLPRMGIALDGSKVVHSSSVYRPDVTALTIDKSKDHRLHYDPTLDLWQVVSDEKIVVAYNTTDLRMSIVYRARCFADAENAARFHPLSKDQRMSLKEALQRLSAEASKRTGKNLDIYDRPNRLELALTVLDAFVHYPPPISRVIPFDWCADAHMTWAAPFLKYLCN